MRRADPSISAFHSDGVTAASGAWRIGRGIAVFGMRHRRHHTHADRHQGADNDPAIGNMKKIGPISQPAKQDKKADDIKAESRHRNLAGNGIASTYAGTIGSMFPRA